jgi:hypothetical protein
MEGGATEAEATEEATEEGATEAEAMEGGATEAADEEEATGAAEMLEAEAARSNRTCHPAPPRRCRSRQRQSHQLHLRRTEIRKETQGGSCRYDHQPRRLQGFANCPNARPLRLRPRPWLESDHRLQLVKNERPRNHRRHRHLHCMRCRRTNSLRSS